MRVSEFSLTSSEIMSVESGKISKKVKKSECRVIILQPKIHWVSEKVSETIATSTEWVKKSSEYSSFTQCFNWF